MAIVFYPNGNISSIRGELTNSDKKKILTSIAGITRLSMVFGGGQLSPVMLVNADHDEGAANYQRNELASRLCKYPVFGPAIFTNRLEAGEGE